MVRIERQRDVSDAVLYVDKSDDGSTRDGRDVRGRRGLRDGWLQHRETGRRNRRFSDQLSACQLGLCGLRHTTPRKEQRRADAGVRIPLYALGRSQSRISSRTLLLTLSCRNYAFDAPLVSSSKSGVCPCRLLLPRPVSKRSLHVKRSSRNSQPASTETAIQWRSRTRTSRPVSGSVAGGVATVIASVIGRWFRYSYGNRSGWRGPFIARALRHARNLSAERDVRLCERIANPCVDRVPQRELAKRRRADDGAYDRPIFA